jgi:hypothetical protein
MRSVVSGKVINVYSENDYILAFLYRATSIQLGVAGLQAIKDVDGVENMNLTKEVSGHLRYPELIGKILKRVGFDGIQVEDAHIEEETQTEIQLLELDAGADGTAHTLSSSGLEDLMAPAPTRNTRPFSSPRDFKDPLNANSPSSSTPPAAAKPSTSPAPIDETAAMLSRTGIASLMDDPIEMDASSQPASSHPPLQKSPANPSPRKPPTHDDDSDSDAGGIQMIDNDEDLTEFDHLPEPEPDDPPIGRDSSKIAARDEQKVLGSFERVGRVSARDAGLY